MVATRKTPWGLLDKRAVHLGGGGTHRLGLWDAILIKNNHLALLANREEDAVRMAVRARLAVSHVGGVHRSGGAQRAGRACGGARISAPAGIFARGTGRRLPLLAAAGQYVARRNRRDYRGRCAREDLLDHVLIEASGNISEKQSRRVCGLRRGCHLHGRADAFGARARSLPKTSRRPEEKS